MDGSLLARDRMWKLTGMPESLLGLEVLTDCNDTVESVCGPERGSKGWRGYRERRDSKC